MSTGTLSATATSTSGRTSMSTITKSQAAAADVSALERARNPLLWIVTREEARVERYLFEANAAAGYQTKFWDIAAGVTALDGTVDTEIPPGDPDAVLEAIKANTGQRVVWVLRDFPVWISPPVGAMPMRRLRNLARWLPAQGRKSAQVIIIITPSSEVPPELSGHATVIEWPLPDRAEIAGLLDAAVASLPDDMQETAIGGKRDAAIDAAVGLSGEEAQATFARSLVSTRTIDPALVAAEKKRVIAKEGLLEWIDPIPGGLSNVGGLDNWKAWAKGRAVAYSPAAREYGLPAPKGALLVGVPGCGKTYSAKCLASELGVPLLRMDLGALKSKYVGESEQNLRKAFGVIESVGRCAVWLDEIEKALAGATGEAGDGGVAADALGAILGWMQDRQGEAFVIATANNAEKLPPELMRKGRFDEVWWVDLPNHDEREAVLAAALRSHKRDADKLGIDLTAVALETDQFTGAEIAALVPEAMFAAFAEDAREITTDDLLAAAGDVTPMAAGASGEKIKALRAFWNGKARNATAKVTAAAPKREVAGIELDLT